MPRVAWIELTSKCPLDCIFCTRRRLHGAGRDMDFELCRSIMAQLHGAERICLNHSGESIVYPHLADAVHLAKATGARTELVTTLFPAAGSTLRDMVEAGLDHVRVSLHTLDPALFPFIYRRKTVDHLKRALGRLIELRESMRSRMRIDFAFVAMRHNVAGLADVAAYAARLGIPVVSILPVTQHDVPDHDFKMEISGSGISEEFCAMLQAAVAETRGRAAGVDIQVISPLAGCPPIDSVPRYCVGPLPPGAHIAGCDQNPWDTVHVLSGGEVTMCEEHRHGAFGNVREKPLRAIWHGPEYAAFRRDYELGMHPQCRECPCKLAYMPSPLEPIVNAAPASAQFVRGWHECESTGTRWSRPDAALVFAGSARAARLRVVGIMPPSADGDGNTLRVFAGDRPVGQVANTSQAFLPFDSKFPLPPAPGGMYRVTFRTKAYCPQEKGERDMRVLGFALSRAEIC